MSLIYAYKKLLATQATYFKQYTYDRPIFFSQKTSSDMKFVQQSVAACIRYFGTYYGDYSHLMPLSDGTCKVLDMCRSIEYKPGTYRTDFVLTNDNKIKLIEITCRFALNGFLRSGFVNVLADDYAAINSIQLEDHYTSFFNDLEKYFGEHETIVLLKDDTFNEGRFIREMLTSAGKKFVTLALEEMPRKIDLIAQSVCITQMRHDELLSLPEDVLKAIVESNLLNDLRTVLLVHDKRFFAVMCDDMFREKVLGKSDAERFKEFLTPTYTKYSHPELWDRLWNEKDNWIIKPPALGMGIGITAGIAASETDWRESLQSFAKSDVTFQPYLQQRRFSGMVGDERRINDYIAGTLLFFQDGYYGPGLFRASGHPVTNQGDDRKISAATLISDDSIEEIVSAEKGWVI